MSTDPNSRDSHFFYLKHDDLPGTQKQRQIQYDGINCAQFTLDTLSHLSQIDPILLLEKEKEKFSTSPRFPGEYKFNATNMPVEMAPIYRGTQYLPAFNSLPDPIRNRVINAQGETLQDSVHHRIEQRDVKGVQKDVNCTIEDIRKDFVQRTNDFLKTDDQAIQKSEERNALTALKKGKFVTITHIPMAVSGLIKEGEEIHKRNKAERPIVGFLDNSKNKDRLKKASEQFDSGNNPKALDNLDKMRRISEGYRKQVGDVRAELSKSSDVKKEKKNDTQIQFQGH